MPAFVDLEVLAALIALTDITYEGPGLALELIAAATDCDDD